RGPPGAVVRFGGGPRHRARRAPRRSRASGVLLRLCPRVVSGRQLDCSGGRVCRGDRPDAGAPRLHGCVPMNQHAGRRWAGPLIPLFSLPWTAGWGFGDIGDVAPMTGWRAAAGQHVLQLLPINEMAPRQQSPYSAISAMAIDPIYIALAGIPDFQALDGERSIGTAERALLDEVRRAPSIDHQTVRRLKEAALLAAFERFLDAEWCHDTDPARALKTFLSEQAGWIEDYAIFRARHAHEGERPWREWPEALQRREPAAIAQARRELAEQVLFRQYLQW